MLRLETRLRLCTDITRTERLISQKLIRYLSANPGKTQQELQKHVSLTSTKLKELLQKLIRHNFVSETVECTPGKKQIVQFKLSDSVESHTSFDDLQPASLAVVSSENTTRTRDPRDPEVVSPALRQVSLKLKICQLLCKSKSMSVLELGTMLQVPDRKIRDALRTLRNNGLVATRSFSGVYFATASCKHFAKVLELTTL